MSKTKYLFGDRQTAEAEYLRQSQLASNYRRMLVAMIAGEVQNIMGDCYDAYFTGGLADGLVMIVYHGADADCQQKPVVSVYTPDEIKDWRANLMSNRDTESRHLCQLIQDVLDRQA